MQVGALDRKIVIEYRSVSTDPVYGSQEVTWVPLAGYLPGSPSEPVQIAANIQDVLPSRAEGVRLQLELSRNPSRLRIRYRTGIDSSMRVREPARGNQIYQIISGPAELGRREWLEMIIEKYSSEGGSDA